VIAEIGILMILVSQMPSLANAQAMLVALDEVSEQYRTCAR